MADVELLFGVEGGSSISSGSGAEIKKDIDGIVRQLNADPFKLKFQVDQTSVTKLRTDLVHLRKEMANTIQQLGQLSQGLGMNKASQDFKNVISQYTKLNKLKFELNSAYAQAKTTNRFKNDANEAARLERAYTSLLGRIKSMAGQKVLNIDGLTQLISEVDKYNSEISETIQLEAQAAQNSQRQARDRIASMKSIYQFEKQLVTFLKKNPMAKGTGWETSINDMLYKIRSGVPIAISELNELRSTFARINTEMASQNKLGLSFIGTVGSMFKKFGGWSMVTGSMYHVTNGFRNMIQNVRDLDTAMTELRKVTSETSQTYTNFFETSIDRAHNLGATVTDTISATADFARLGYGIEDASTLADAALVYKNVGDGIDDINVASESIISTMQGFGVAASDAMLVVDKFNEVGNNFSISSVGIGDALVRSAAALSSANNTLDESIALVTATNKVVQDPEKVGTTLKTVSMYLRAAKTEAEEAGIETDGMADSMSKLRGEILALTGNQVDIQLDEDTFKSTYQIMKEIAGVWDQISDVSQANILEKLGGKRNANVVAALIQNFGEAEQVLATAANASGSALAENEKYLDSIEGKITQFRGSFEAMSAEVLDTGFVKGIVEGGTAALDVITALVDKLGAVPTLMGLITGAFTAYQIGAHGTNQLFDFERLDDGRIKMSLFNQELSDIQTRFAQARASGEGFFSSLYKGVKDPFAKYGDSINHFNDALKSGSVDMGKYVDTLDDAGGALNRYLKSLRPGEVAQMAGFKNYCKANSIALKEMSLSAKAAGVAVKGLGVALNVAASVGIGLLISALTSLVVSLATAGETLRENTLTASSEYKDAASSLSSYKAEVESLNASLASNTLSEQEAYEARSRLLEIQDSLKSSYGAEASGLNLITMSAEEAAAAIEKLAVAEAQAFLYDNSNGILQAKRNMGEAKRTIGFSGADVDDYSLGKLEKIANGLGIELKDNGGQMALSITADVTDAHRAFQEFKTQAEAQGINLGDIRSGTVTLESALNTQISRMSQLEAEYGETYDQYISASITASKEYSTALQGLTDAQSSYEEAVSKSYTSEKERADAVVQSIAQIEHAKASVMGLQFSAEDEGIKNYFEAIVGDLDSLYAGEKLKLDLGLADKASIKEYTGLVKEYQRAIAETKEVTGKDFLGVEKFGNIDTGIRERLEWTTENVELYRKAIESWGASADEYLGSYSTVDGRSDKFGDYEIAFTPMLNTKDGVEYLDKDSVYGYIKKIISEAEKDGSVSQAEILRLDTKGLEVDGKKISNIIAAVGDDAIKVGELMHFTGANGAINDAFNRLGGEYGDKNAISSMIDALGKLDQDSDGVTKISEILETMAKVDSGAADVLKEDADAIELIRTMAESANVPVETFLNTLSEVGLTRGYIGDALSALTAGLGSVEAGFSAASQAASGYQERMKAIEDEGGEKNSNFTVYASAYDKVQEQVKAGTTESNAFWESAELLLGEEKLRDLEYNSKAVVEQINSVKKAWQSEGDNGEGFFNYVYGLQQQGKLLDENNRQLIDIQKNGSEWKFDFDTEDLDQILPVLNMTEEGFYACLEAMNMWRVSSGADATEIAERIDQLGLSVENANEKFIASDSIEESLEPLYGKQGAYRAVQELEELGYTLISVQDILADSEGGAQTFADALSKMGVATADGDSLVVNLDDMTKSLTEMGMTSSEIASLLSVLGEIEGLSLVDAEGQLVSLDNAIKQVTRGDATVSLGELAAAATTSAEALKKFEGNEDLDIKINVSDIEDTDDKISALDDTIAKMNKIKAKPKVDPSEVEHANDVISYCVVQKQMLSQPEVMAVETDQVEGELGNVISLLQDFQNLQNTKELYLALGMNEAVEGEGGIQAQIDKKISEIQATDPKIQAGLKIDSTSEESLQASIDSLTAGMMISVGVNPTAIAGAEEGQTCTVTYTPNTDALPESFDTIDRTVAYKPNLKALPSRLSKITRIVEYVPTGDTEVNGTAHAAGTAKAWGDWGTAPGGRTLVGELGQEIVVNPRTGRWYTVGDFGAEFVNIEPGSIVFNHKQTQSLLENGFVAGRGHALASGTAAFINSGSGTPPSLSGTTSISSSPKKSTYKANLEVEADTSKLEESMKDALDKIKEEVERIIGDYEHKIFLTEKNNGNLEDIVAAYKKMQDTVHDYADQYRAKGLDENSDYITDLQKQWWEYEEAIVEAISTAYEEARSLHENDITLLENSLEDAISIGDVGGMREYTDSIIDAKKAMRSLLQEQIAMYRAEGLADNSDEITEAMDLWHDLGTEIEEAAQQIIDSVSDMVDEVEDAYNTLHKAADEYAESGYITVDTLQDIISLGPQYLAFLIDENGQLVINEERINAVIKARTEQLAIETALNYVKQIRTAVENGEIATLNNLLYATQVTTGATWELVYANLALAGLNGEQYAAAMRNINALRALSITAQKSIGQINKDTKKKTLESLEEMQDGMENIVDYVMDMLADRLEQQIDALEEQKDQYADIIDLKKESLEATKAEDDYQKSQAEKLKKIAKLQAQIELLKLDDSREAQARRIALEEELAELQGDLADEQADKLLETQTDTLDKMQEANEKRVDAEIEELEKTASSYEKRWQQAIDYIENNWSTLHKELLAWNYEYGDVLNSEITDAYNAASAALQKYGSDFSTVLGRIRSEIESLKNSMDSSFNTNLGSTYTPSDDELAEADKLAVGILLSEMKANSAAWDEAHKAGNKTLEKELADANVKKAKKLEEYGIYATKQYGIKDGRWNGVWYDKDGTNLYQKYAAYIYHKGGIVGGGDVKANEQFALLENDEWVLSRKMVENLSAQMDRINMLRGSINTFTSGITDMITSKTNGFLNSIANSPTAITVTIGDTIISGANGDTVKQHMRVSEDMVNQIARVIGIRR